MLWWLGPLLWTMHGGAALPRPRPQPHSTEELVQLMKRNRNQLLTPRERPRLGPRVLWRRVTGVAHAPYRCRNLTPPSPHFSRSCFRQAHERIATMRSRKLWVYPVSFCFPRPVAEWYHRLLWNSTKTLDVRGGSHSRSVGSVRVYADTDEEAYLGKYAAAKVVATRKKGGWDCLRHLEILVAGALLQFHNAAALDPLTLFHYPKECLAEMADAAALPAAAYEAFRAEAWAFFTAHLTCDSLVRFMMLAMEFDPCAEGPVLFLDHHVVRQVNYQANAVFAGLRAVLGPYLDVWREPTYMYSDWSGDHRKLYGNGFAFGMSLDPAFRSKGIPDTEVVRRLRAKHYKLVVYGSILRSRPFWEEVTAALPPHRVWAVTGDDPAAGTEDFFLNGRARNATVFVREMRTTHFHCPVRAEPTASPGSGPTSHGVALRSGPPPPPEPPPRTPGAGGNGTECVRQAAARIAGLDVARRVYPISLCLPRKQLPHSTASTAWSRRKKVFRRADQSNRGEVDPGSLAEYQFALLNSKDDSLFLLQVYAAGALPLWPAAPPAPP
eukprot:EG_transcript_7929